AGGALVFYISKTDAWNENGSLLKLGRVRVQLSPNPFTTQTSEVSKTSEVYFQQTLKLRQGEIEIRAGAGDSQVTLRVWVDALHPVVRVEAESAKAFEIRIVLEIWRHQKRLLTGGEIPYQLGGSPAPVYIHPDTTLEGQQGRIVWYHRNPTSIWEDTMKVQGLESLMGGLSDPLLHRTFGGVIQGEGLISENATMLKSEGARKRFTVSIYPHTQQTATPEDWIRAVEGSIAHIEALDLEKTRSEHQAWWNQFWNRSWIRVSGATDAEVVSRGYALQRFINACGGRGAYPIPFRASIFWVDGHGWPDDRANYDPDFQGWGGCYWWQNQRLIYWPMLASGDYDLMQPHFRMYRDMLPLLEERTPIYFGQRSEGAYLLETHFFWGTYNNENYGWPHERKDLPVGVSKNRYIRYEWQGGIELTAQMLDYYAFTQDAGFLQNTLLPFAQAISTFYDQHYPRDADGKIRFWPSQALETYWDSLNPLPEIAGLQFVLKKLLALPEDATGAELRQVWTRLLNELPPLPTQQMDGEIVLAPAEELGPKSNQENPELYAIFPYRIFGVGKPELDLARRTFAHRLHKGSRGWNQDDTQMALLGLTDEAREFLVWRYSNKHSESRFPAFWGPNYDGVPDQCHGGNALMALQTMLMQTEDEKILLFPAWPKDWDVAFKLHAPYNTSVEGVYRNGKLERLQVLPEGRAKDVVVMDAGQK
ncbi:hypothetical protein HYR99_14120, partial [Candidatus Poribacteria bacterium]|nr:hypothetical protein [Candidatus Poribacteria bacterium]